MWYVSMRYNRNTSYKLHIAWGSPSSSSSSFCCCYCPPLSATFNERRQPNLINPNSRKRPPVFFSSFSCLVHRALLMTFSFIVLWSCLVFLALGHALINWTARVKPSKVPFYNVDLRALERQIQMYLYLYAPLSSFDTHNRAIDFTSQTLNLIDTKRERESEADKPLVLLALINNSTQLNVGPD